MKPIVALLLSASPALAASAPAHEMRGLWVVRTALISPQAVDRVVDQAAEGGLNALFVQVRGRGDAFYTSKLVVRSVLLENQPASFDPLARLIARARARGLQVHAWVNVLLSAHFGQPLPPGHVIAEHPEWLMVPRSVAPQGLSVAPKALPWLVLRASRGDTDVEGYYLSPSAPGVREHLEEVVREIVHGYPVDGLHLDFIRYPGPEYDYSRAALEGFRKARGGSGDLLGGPLANTAAWDDYRRQTLTALADGLSRAARFERPGLVVSAAVVPDEAAALSQKYQPWPVWISRGILDAVCPMTYTPDSRLFRSELERARAIVGAGSELWAGVGAYRMALEGVIEKVREAREAGASGVLLFSHESLGPADWRRLREAAFTPAMTAAEVAAGAERARADPR
jgi:uncharacterized lipoprotein YddW (UPF0748 family)